jgi:uncharacterized membrane protein
MTLLAKRELQDLVLPELPEYRPPRLASPDASRVGWSLASILVALMAMQSWTGSLAVPTANVASTVLIAFSLFALVWCWMSKGPLSTRFQCSVMVALAAAITYYAVLIWVTQPAYGTDAVAFDQYAAQLVLHGVNPYGVSMAPAFQLFHVPVIFRTFELNGSVVTGLSYPAGSFLPYVPLLALGVHAQEANIVDLVFWIVGMFLAWRMLPADLRWVAPIIMSAEVYLYFIFGGVTDALFVPFVIAAVYRWDRFGDLSRSRAARWAGPICLGVAMTIKQTPWFLLPFLLVGVVIEARASGRSPLRIGLSYLALTVGTFFVINAPFLVTAPTAWVKGALLPLLDPTIPDGQGLVTLTLFEHVGGGHLSLLNLAGALLYLVGIALFLAFYPRLKRAWMPLVLLSFFMPSRSLGSYLIMMMPAAIVAGTTIKSRVATAWPALRRWGVVALATSVVAVVGCAGAAMASPAPLAITVLGTRSTGQLLTIDEVYLQVTNRTDHPLSPHFSVNDQGRVTTFWYPYANGRAYQLQLPPRATRRLILHVPNAASEAAVASPFTVEAFSTSPSSVSVSQRYLVSPLSLYLTPAEVDLPVSLGKPVRMEVQLQNQFGSDIHRAGVKVFLGQVVYAEEALVPGEASINGAPEGQTPVEAVTDANGNATFIVRGVQAQSDPVYFQGWIDDAGQVPHGYSNLVLIQFG